MDDFIIRQAEPADADALAAIGAATFTESFSRFYLPEDVRAHVALAFKADVALADLAAPSAAWLAQDGGQCVGYATAGVCDLHHPEVGPRSLQLKRIYVLATWQNAGVGRRLWAEAMGWLTAQGPADLWIACWSENHRVLRMSRRHGFEKVGEQDFRVGLTVDRELILKRVCTLALIASRPSAEAAGGDPAARISRDDGR